MIAKQLVEKAMKKAHGAQASLSLSESVDVSYESDRLKSAESSQRTDMSIRVIVDGKVGFSHTTDINDVDGVVSRALELAEFGSPAHYQFPSPKDGTDVNVYDRAILGITKDEMVTMGEEMIALVKEYKPEILLYAGASKSSRKGEFANSNGVEYADESTIFSASVYGEWIRGTDILSAGHGLGWRKRGIDHIEIARKAIELFKMAEKIARIKSGDMPVIFTPEGMYTLLLSLEMGFNGKNVYLGSSPLAGKLGEKIADEKLTIIDNPLIDYAPNSSKYDAEGVPHQITPLIEKGVAKNFLYDLDTAGRAGATTTGHGTGCGPTNIVIETGDTSYEGMLKNTKNGLLVHNVMGLGQGNPISGEFSVNVQLGYRIQNGEIIGRVKDVMLAGNTYDAIKDIVAIGDKAEWVGGSLLTPHIQIGRLSVVAQ